MTGLVKTYFSAAGQRNCRLDSPGSSLDFAALNILRFQRGDGGVDVVAHQVQDRAEKIVSSVALRKFSFYRVNAGFGRRHRENQPPLADVDEREFKDIAKEGPIRLGIFAVEQEMSTDNHAAKYMPDGSDVFDLIASRS
jgi:hypothetical protein